MDNHQCTTKTVTLIKTIKRNRAKTVKTYIIQQKLVSLSMAYLKFTAC